uniref:Uncharacterized protein n=1 Tax=Chelydra serpentina TaxID=8475 RepID=A0A8C3RPK7_CHESE
SVDKKVYGIHKADDWFSFVFTAQEAVTQCSLQLRKIGDICNLQQKILNVITKLFCPGT